MEWNETIEESTFMMPSDSTARHDVQLLELGQIEESEVEKRRLEDLQRADKQLRDKAKKAKAAKTNPGFGTSLTRMFTRK